MSKLDNPNTFRNLIGLSNLLKTHSQAEMHMIIAVIMAVLGRPNDVIGAVEMIFE